MLLSYVVTSFVKGSFIFIKRLSNWMCVEYCHNYRFRQSYLWRLPVGFFTPEALLNHRKWRNLLRTDAYVSRLRVIVIDEAHIVVKW